MRVFRSVLPDGTTLVVLTTQHMTGNTLSITGRKLFERPKEKEEFASKPTTNLDDTTIYSLKGEYKDF